MMECGHDEKEVEEINKDMEEVVMEMVVVEGTYRHKETFYNVVVEVETYRHMEDICKHVLGEKNIVGNNANNEMET
ncbi:hypothetical protein Lal_00013931 [Lupinus albus]|nr:hypothetical protein Lal_00013931 [Lupinus albus]